MVFLYCCFVCNAILICEREFSITNGVFMAKYSELYYYRESNLENYVCNAILIEKREFSITNGVIIAKLIS